VVNIAIVLFCICTGKNDLTRRVTHREAVFGPVIHSIIDAWHYEVLWTCESTRFTMIHMRLWALDTIHHTAFNKTAKCTSLHAPKYALMYTPDCNRLHTPSLLDCMLPSKLSRRSQAHSQSHLAICSHICSWVLDPETC
jgi:hypothetical protein